MWQGNRGSLAVTYDGSDDLVAATEPGAQNRHPTDGDDHNASRETGQEGPFEETYYQYCEGMHHSQSYRCLPPTSRIDEYTFVYPSLLNVIPLTMTIALQNRDRGTR